MELGDKAFPTDSLAIGPNSALFSVVDAALLNLPPIQGAGQIVGITT